MIEWKPITIYLREDGANSAILLWPSAKKNIEIRNWVEVHGDLDNWTADSLFHQIHDIKRINVSQLHAGEVTQILPEWEGYDIVRKALENG